MTIRHIFAAREVALIYKVAIVLAFLGFVLMSGAIVYGFVVGDFAAEGSYLASIPWGQVSLIDVYLGFLLVCGWILYREASFGKALPWLILMMIFGNATACLYVFLALTQGQGDPRAFWLGSRA